MAGYHIREIERGELGEFSKIEEEFAELRDACDQGVKLMQLIELSDLLGAIELFLGRHHPSITLDDLVRMKDVTARAFRDGTRGPSRPVEKRDGCGGESAKTIKEGKICELCPQVKSCGYYCPSHHTLVCVHGAPPKTAKQLIVEMKERTP